MPSDEFEVPKEVGGYALLERLARARTGSVHRAKDKDGRMVVVRLPADRESAPSGSRRPSEILTEVSRLLEKVRHPVIPRLIERGTHDDRPFAVFELASGERLDRILEEQRLAAAAVIELGRNLSRALAEAHRAGVVHGDVCPRSVLLGGGGGTVHLLGWGASRPRGTPLQKEVPRAATVPPEIEADPATKVSPRTDVHGVGAVLYEALAFAPPRPRKAELPPLLRDPLPIRDFNPTVPPLLEAVVLKALEADPSRRYASAEDLAQDLDALAAGREPVARPAGNARLLAQLVRRQPVPAAVLALGLATLLSVSATASVLARARSEHAKADLAAFDAALGRGELETARASLERARRLDADSPGVARAESRLVDAEVEAREREGQSSRGGDLASALAAGREALERARARGKDLPGLAQALDRASREARPLDPALGPEKRALERARLALEGAARERAQLLGEAEAAFRRALRLAPEDQEPRAGLAEVALEAVAALDADRDLERELVAREQRTAEVLLGGKTLPPASLVVACEPAGADLEVRRTGANTVKLVPGEARDLPPGDVLLVATRADHVPEELPLTLVPGRATRIELRLVRTQALKGVPEGFDPVLVPAQLLHLPPAPAPLAGEDATLAASSTAGAASAPVALAAALVARRPVTRGEYARFLRTLDAAGLTEHLPRDASGAFLGETPDALESTREEPVAGVGLASARAYARFAGARLPTRAELWAARARGAEGVLREIVDEERTGGPPDSMLVLDLRVVRGERDVSGDERLERASARFRDVTFRLARPVPEGR